MTNAEIARIMRDISTYLEMEGVAFKPRAYEKAAYAIESVEEPLSALYRKEGLKGIEDIPGVGKSIAEKIVTLIETGHLSYYERLRRETPVDIEGLSAVEGLGPKMIKALFDELSVKTVEDLEQAAREGKIRNLPHFGVKSEEKILKGLSFLKTNQGRLLLGLALPLITEIEERLQKVKGVKAVAVAGSIRRRKETVGDGDILAVSSKPDDLMEFFVHMSEVVHVYAKGSTKSSVKLRAGIDVDLRVVPAESFGAALQYFTGSKSHNIELRKLAQKKRLKLSEYGVFKGKKRVAGQTEEEVYDCLGLDFVPPEMRENSGEVEAAKENRLPRLIDYGDLRGDLQIQTNWTDGSNSIEEMVQEAKRLGLEYIAITDHTRSLPMTGGSDEKKLKKQMAAIDALNKKVRGVTVLKGAEVNIQKDGTLDIADETLARLDVVGIAVHSHFNLSRKEMTSRIVRAMENPHADILFHPTGRILQKRKAYEVDMEEVIRAAKRTGTVLEIDALPERLDLKDEHVRMAVEAGVPLAIDSDAHNVHQIHLLHFGVGTARRGWAGKPDIVNTKPLTQFLRCLKGGGKKKKA